MFLDIIAIIALLWAVFKGFKHGFIIEASGFLALILGAVLASRFIGFTVSLLSSVFNFSSFQEYPPVLIFIVNFIVIVFFISLTGRILSKTVATVSLAWFDKLAGIIFGMLKTLLLCSFLVLLFDSINSKTNLVKRDSIEKSFFYNPLLVVSKTLIKLKVDVEKKRDDASLEMIVL